MGLRDRVFAQLIGIGQDILTTQLDALTRTISAQLGDATAGVPDIDEAQWTQTPGIWSLPAAPTPDTPVNGGIAAQAVTVRSSKRDVVVAVRDVRTNAIYGNLKPGDTCVGASSGPGGGVLSAARTLYKAAQGVAVTMTKDANGKDVQLYVGPDKIQLANAFGAITIDENGISLTAGQAGLTLTPAGVATLSGTQCAVSGSLVAIAGQLATCVGNGAVPSGVPGTTPGPTSALLGLTGVAAVPSANVFLGP